ncbi:hypothetical protein SARC_08465 [Sphaeroforma arctica JP610]|uniref:Fungal lipase-type domain-containing protein n=1 Tax=Sphaeroforma arctica JP610 TaxID=667725 RepID=A0A0L0FR18_9EUKA|nr:hypothetical protein SARC_08465 [Sphaeroforma arctica JP610]KNC79129.1 hypothetical protein SARC_08465 [Sphaeroforma arctica JP610]|eukprot:XP_014153031.1 hypothetical protein SARC_08465 [Sphaeroforma arctica JP610]
MWGVGVECKTLLMPSYVLDYNKCANLNGYRELNLQVLYRAQFSPLQPSLNSTSIGNGNNTQLILGQTPYAYTTALNQAKMLYTTSSSAFVVWVVAVHAVLGVLMVLYTVAFAKLSYAFEQAAFSEWLVERKWALVQCVCACFVITDPVYYLALTSLVGDRNPQALTIVMAVDGAIVNFSVGVIFFLNLCFLDSFGTDEHSSVRDIRFYGSKLAFFGVWVTVVVLLCVGNVLKDVQTFTTSLVDALRPWGTGITYAILSYYFLTLIYVWYRTSAALKGEWNYRARYRQLGFRMMVSVQSTLFLLIMFETLCVRMVFTNRYDVFKYSPYTGLSLLFFKSIGVNVYIIAVVFSLSYCYLPPHNDASRGDERTCVDILVRSSYVRGPFSLYTANAMCSGSRLAYRYVKNCNPETAVAAVECTEISRVSSHAPGNSSTRASQKLMDRAGEPDSGGCVGESVGVGVRSGNGGVGNIQAFKDLCDGTSGMGGMEGQRGGRSHDRSHGVQASESARAATGSEGPREGDDYPTHIEIDSTLSSTNSVPTDRNTPHTYGDSDKRTSPTSGDASLTDKATTAASADLAKDATIPTAPNCVAAAEEVTALSLWDDGGRAIPYILQTDDCRSSDTDFDLIEYITDERTDTHCIIYRQDGRLIITFRGTVSAGNAATDLRANLIPICSAVENKDLGKARFKHSCSVDDSECRKENVRVHRGFQTAFVSVRTRVIAQVRAQIALHKARLGSDEELISAADIPLHRHRPRNSPPTNPKPPQQSSTHSNSPPPYGQPHPFKSGPDTPPLRSPDHIHSQPHSSTHREYTAPVPTHKLISSDCENDGMLAHVAVTPEETVAPDALHIFVTGHSLGAALCTLCAWELSHAFDPSELDMTVYTFGSPRVGNANFVYHYNKRLPHTHRIVTDGDPVTSLPKFRAPSFLNVTYKHVGKCYVLAEMGDLIVDPNFPERFFQLKAKRKPVTHRMPSYRLALVECITRMHQRANGGGVSYDMGHALTVITGVFKAHIALFMDDSNRSGSPHVRLGQEVEDDALMIAAFGHIDSKVETDSDSVATLVEMGAPEKGDGASRLSLSEA